MNDWHYFRDNPSRSYRLRLATRAEVEDLRAHGVFDRTCSLADGCSICALSRKRPDGTISTILLVLRVGDDEFSEAECREQWFKADRILAGKVEGLQQ